MALEPAVVNSGMPVKMGIFPTVHFLPGGGGRGREENVPEDNQ